MRFIQLLVLVFASMLVVPAFAAENTVDDCIKLAANGAGESVLEAWAETHVAGNISTADVIKLKSAKVPDKVIATLLRGGAKVPVNASMRTVEARPAAGTQAMPVQSATTTYVEPEYYEDTHASESTHDNGFFGGNNSGTYYGKYFGD